MPLFSRTPEPSPPSGEARARRVLFLDDDPGRAEVFLADYPEAVWVETAAECIARLGEPWDEVHLDHDLGGEHFVDHSRDDCGMEVVRWLCLHPRPHLARTRFQIHSHNPQAATMMGMQMMINGYAVEVRPFGSPPSPPLSPPAAGLDERLSPLAALGRVVRRFFGRWNPEGYRYPDDPLSPEPLDRVHVVPRAFPAASPAEPARDAEARREAPG